MVKADQRKAIKKNGLGILARSGAQYLIFMTDAVNWAETLNTVYALPKKSLVIFRGYNEPNRMHIAETLCRAVQAAGHLFLVAGDAQTARRVGADGLHMPEYMLSGSCPNLFGFRVVTAACHTRTALNRAAAMGVDIALVSPVFQTKSHPDARPLGLHRFARLIEGALIPVAALGGVNPQTAGYLRALNITAIAGMSSII